MLWVASAFKFNETYSEDVVLNNGMRARLRVLRPADRRLIEEGFRRLSERGRYLRFFVAKERLTEEELRYLTEIDGVNHFAVGAIRLDDGDREREGLGIARFVRLPADPETAEPAVAITDEAQQKGLGTLLSARLIAAAAERGIKRFRFEMLESNDPARQMIHKYVPEARIRHEGNEAFVEFGLQGHVVP